ncbi:MAG TPA: ATP-dependent helicase HrpB [Myxococcaceae bacterium]|nr:ATP-dependent helicase HrpB [Myxococcaceae bacterium]
MAVPTAPLTAAQIAQQKAGPEQASQQVSKQGQSKFDHAMAQGTQQAQGVQGPSEVQRATQVQRVQQTQQVQQVNKLDPTQLNKVGLGTGQGSSTLSSKALTPITAKAETNKTIAAMSSMVAEMEKGQGLLDKLIQGGLKGVKFNNTQLLSLQAGMYKYTQELDLTGKVVDKATTGLKETLKTQV